MSADGPVFEKFSVHRTDGSDAPGEKHHGCTYFVLDLTHDPHARKAARAYAQSCEGSHPRLSASLRELVTDLFVEAHTSSETDD